MSEKTNIRKTRENIIIRTSIIGIAANVLLAGFKAVIGLLSSSIAVVLDAVNNLSDALSSVITIVGTKLASKKPDKKHPLGYGRIEYLTSMLVAAIVLYAGITSGIESLKKIISPEKPDYSKFALVIIASAVLVKFILGRYVIATGKKVNSGALIASGSDAISDAVLSLSVFISALIYIFTGVSLEAYVGIIISLFIIKAGYDMLIDTLDEILGKRIGRDYLKEIKETICEDKDVMGAYDLILHSYGPDNYIGSVHVEIAEDMMAKDIDAMERRITENVFARHGVALAGIGIYSVNSSNDEIGKMRTDIIRRILQYEGVLQIHGFYADTGKKEIHADVIIDFAVDDRNAVYERICSEIQTAYPDYTFYITMDIDF